ncbi:MAG: 6-phosphogluconolactonase [Gammaproteobacteria bacterium]|nr:6-phosphogluconolactonase [Gammaproteobacteria bacterium]
MTTLTTRRFGARADLEAALTVRLSAALTAPGAHAVMLSGGETPLPVYRRLAKQGLRHDDRLHVLFSDERYVPSDAAASNFHQSWPLLETLGLPAESLLRVPTERSLAEATAAYDRALATLLASGIPLGLGLLGLGADGHTASLFTAQDLERARGRFAIEVARPDGLSAVSVTPELLANVREPLFVVIEAGKEQAVQRLLARDTQLTAWRAVQGCSDVELWLAAA